MIKLSLIAETQLLNHQYSVKTQHLALELFNVIYIIIIQKCLNVKSICYCQTVENTYR